MITESVTFLLTVTGSEIFDISLVSPVSVFFVSGTSFTFIINVGHQSNMQENRPPEKNRNMAPLMNKDDLK